MNRSVKAIAFDLEGTLVDLERAHFQAHLDAASELGLHLTLERAIEEIPAFVWGPKIEIARSIQSRRRKDMDLYHLLNRMKHFYGKRQVKAVLT